MTDLPPAVDEVVVFRFQLIAGLCVKKEDYILWKNIILNYPVTVTKTFSI
jgi:hypothetical protein